MRQKATDLPLYMITRSPIVPHTCLSCRRTLARKKLVPGTQISNRTYSQPRQESAFEDALEDENGSTNAQSDASSFRIRRTPVLDTRRPSVNRHSGTRSIGNGETTRFHGHKGRKLQENVQELGVKSLGGSANAVVLQDSKFTYYTHEAKIEDLTVERVDIGKRLDEERGIVSPDQVYQSINELRPGDGQEKVSMSWEEFNKHVKVLSEGFTTAQIQAYIERFKQENEKRSSQDVIPGPEEDQPSDEMLFEMRPWRPGVTSNGDSFHFDPLQGYAVSSYTSKQKVALQIVRECWEVEATDLVEGIGQFEVILKEQDLRLLLGELFR